MITPRTSPTTTDSGSDTSPVLDLVRPDWWASALCSDPAARAAVGMHFVDAEFNKTAKAAALQICGKCEARQSCLEYALADPTLQGVFGGTDSAARRAIRSDRSRQEITSATP